MANEATKFDTELARIYDETRLIDPEAFRACFRDALQDVARKANTKIADVGCGTGRVLECLIPDLFQKDQVVGIDISHAMLEVARNKAGLVGVEFQNVSAVEFAATPDNQKRFDVVICHWVFHCAPDWQKVFKACIDIAKEGGVIIWLEEEGDLYRALDGMDTHNEPLKRLFDAYYASVNKELYVLGMDAIDPSSRVGTALRCTDDLANELRVWGWKIKGNFKVRFWTKQVTINWIVETILKNRVFTNLRQIPVAVNQKVIETLRRGLGSESLPGGDTLLSLRFSAKPIVADFASFNDEEMATNPTSTLLPKACCERD